VQAVRTPVGKHGGSLANVRPDDLAAIPIKAVVERSGVDPSSIDDVILGCANQAGEDNRNVARMALLLAGLPVEVPGQTVNRLCGSGLQAVASAAQAIKAGEGATFITGGVESMTRAPYVMLKPGEPFSRKTPEMADTTVGWRFVNPRMKKEWTISLGETAEVVAERYKISRADQDAFAVESQRRAEKALKECVFTQELVPVTLSDGSVFAKDEYPRAGTTMDSVAKLKPAFKKDGTVTAGNAPSLNDAASALVVASRSVAEKLGAAPLADIVAYATSGMAPEWVMMAPEEAVRQVWKKAGWKKDDVDLYEFNEAFSVQQIALGKVLEIDPKKHNVNGGAVALGHPIGASGARVLTTLLYALEQRNLTRGIAALCLGGGNAVAMAVERRKAR